ncbi:unnamed protein product, partial [marine sediment metagenome]
MAKLLNKAQPIQVGVKNPTSVYSRVVSCSDVVTHMNPRAIYTVVVGQVVRLLEVKLFWQPQPPESTSVTYFKVMTGLTAPRSAQDMSETWDNVLPKLGAGHIDADWYHAYGVTEMSWQMNMLFRGSERRFGMFMITVMPGKGQACQASFEISE